MKVIKSYKIEIQGQKFTLNETEFESLRKAVNGVKEAPAPDKSDFHKLLEEYNKMHPAPQPQPWRFPHPADPRYPSPFRPGLARPEDVICRVTTFTDHTHLKSS